MAKKREQKNKEIKTHTFFDADEKIGKYFFYILPVLVLVYFIYSLYSDGFYQDEEYAHYFNMLRFWDEPYAILGNWPKPGYKILFVLPALLGYKFVTFVHAVITAFAVLMVYLTAKELKIKNASIVAILFAFQPFILQFSFRLYAELVAGVLVLLTLYFYCKKNNILTALFSTWTFAARQEFALISIILGILFLIPVYKKLFKKDDTEIQSKPFSYYLIHNILPFFILGLSPLIINFFGYLNSGDPFYLLTDMKHIGLEMKFIKRGFFHFPSMFIFIVGPLTFGLFLAGYLGFLRNKSAYKEYFTNYGMLFTIITIYFVVQIISSWEFLDVGTNPGTLRYIIPIVPLAALFAGVGLEHAMKGKDKKYVYLVLAAVAIITLVFLSYKDNKLVMLSEKEYFKFSITAILFFIVLFLNELKMNPKIFLVLIMVLGVGFTLIDEKPIKLDPERKTIQEAADWWQSNGYDQRLVLHNHIYFFFVINVHDKHNYPDKYLDLLQSTLQKAPVGSIALWDSHYNNRPEYNLDVPIEYFENNSNFQFLKQFMASDRRFVIYAFEKVKDF
jgi:hypothetical protein